MPWLERMDASEMSEITTDRSTDITTDLNTDLSTFSEMDDDDDDDDDDEEEDGEAPEGDGGDAMQMDEQRGV